MLASAKIYLQSMLNLGLSVDDACQQMELQLCVDTDYFVSIAKLRAARTLWAQFARACGASETASNIALHANTSDRMLTQHDPWVNMLRTTVAGSAAALGGCDSLSVSSYDQALGVQSELGRRVARNIQIIMQEESNLHRVVDPLGGSGYIEHLTESLCSLAWEEFTQIESQGGLSSALKEGFVQRSINDAWHDLQHALSTRRQAIIGVTEYPEPSTGNKSPAVPTPEFSAANSQTAALPLVEHVEPLLKRRLSTSFETLHNTIQIAAREHSIRLELFAAVLGAAADYSEQLSFCQNLLGIAGLTLAAVEGDYSLNKTVEEFKHSQSAIAVVCVPRELDIVDVAKLIDSLREVGAKAILFAGSPDDANPLNIDLYLYRGCDTLQSLNAVASLLEIDLS